jgi:alpha-1,3/alpha-1,6-mannosyltransferase
MADRVVVNSRFTAARFREAFPRLAGLEPDVVYPGVDVLPCPDLPEEPEPGPVTLLSLGRDDPRKSLGLAIEAIAALRGRIPPALFARLRLVIAGGRDARVRMRGVLEPLARRLGVEAHVVLQAAPSEAERMALLSACRCVVFTPAAEHFGYVPVEAMAAGRPVVAVNQGGPTETIADGETGFLCAPTPDAFAVALARLLGDGAVAARMGRAGRARVAAGFSRAAFGARIERILLEAVENY